MVVIRKKVISLQKLLLMSGVEILGYSAGAKTRKEILSKDISLQMFLIAAINEIMWVMYGSLSDNRVIILTNPIVLSMSLMMIYFKLKYK